MGYNGKRERIDVLIKEILPEYKMIVVPQSPAARSKLGKLKKKYPITLAYSKDDKLYIVVVKDVVSEILKSIEELLK